MARAILTAIAIFAMTTAAQAAPVCEGGGEEGVAIAETALDSPLYAYLEGLYGEAQVCAVTVEDGDYAASILFGEDAEMTVEATPSIGTAAYAATTNGATRPAPAEVPDLMHRIELWAAEPDGCGISVEQLQAGIAGDAAETVVEGDSCNCRATVREDQHGITGLRFSAAC